MMVSRLAEKENYDGMFFFFLHVVVYMIMVGRLTKKKEVKLGRAGSLLASRAWRAPAELQTLKIFSKCFENFEQIQQIRMK